MQRFARILTAGLLLAGAGLAAGCGGNAAGLTTSSTAPADSKIPSNDDPMARPAFVAWTAARAKRCGFFFDAAKLRSAYLAYESRQGQGPANLANIEKVYDQTFKSTSDSAWAQDDYCSERKGADIKQELARHLAGDYAPNFPKPKVVADCGIFGCSAASEEPFDSKKFWQKNDADKISGRR
jgi:hypothetical protein